MRARERLLASASRLFAERGLDGVSVREIAADAGVGHAGVNYHFRTKADLYREVLRQNAPEQGRGLEGLEDDGSPGSARARLEAWLRGFIEQATTAPGVVAQGLIRHEFLRPGGPSDLVYRTVIGPHHRGLEALIARVRPDLDEIDLRIAAVGIISQGLIFRLSRNVTLRNLGVDDLDADLRRRISERFVENALRGLGLERDAPPAPERPAK